MQPYTDALERALGQVVARATSQLELLKAQADAAVAAANSRVSDAENKLLAIDAKVSARLAELKDGEPGPPGQDGKDADMATVAGLVEEQVSRAVAELPAPEKGDPGQDADIESVKAIIADTVGAAIASLPKPKDGADGHDVSDIDVVQAGAILEFGFTVGDTRSIFEIELPAGPPGEPGERGEEGATGKLDQVRAWSSEVHYEGQIRTHRGSTYQALRDTGREPPHEDWLLISAAGADGVDGRSFSIAQTWQPDKEYAALDVVALNGGSFVARKNNPGPCPGEDWQVLAQRGKAGPPGEKGAKGDRGDPGAPVVSISVDDEGLLSLTNGDGSIVTCDLYPLLSRLGGS